MSSNNFYERSLRDFYFIHICSALSKNVNQIAVNKSKTKHC